MVGKCDPWPPYGAPVCSHRLTGVRRNRTMLNSVQRHMDIRIAVGYRIVSFDAATVLARYLSLDILAEFEKWRQRLEQPWIPQQRAVSCMLPSLKAGTG